MHLLGGPHDLPDLQLAWSPHIDAPQAAPPCVHAKTRLVEVDLQRYPAMCNRHSLPYCVRGPSQWCYHPAPICVVQVSHVEKCCSPSPGKTAMTIVPNINLVRNELPFRAALRKVRVKAPTNALSTRPSSEQRHIQATRQAHTRSNPARDGTDG